MLHLFFRVGVDPEEEDKRSTYVSVSTVGSFRISVQTLLPFSGQPCLINSKTTYIDTRVRSSLLCGAWPWILFFLNFAFIYLCYYHFRHLLAKLAITFFCLKSSNVLYYFSCFAGYVESQLCQFYAWLSPLASNDCFIYTLQTAITVDCIYPSTHMFCWRSQLQGFDSIASPLERVFTLADNDRKWQLHQTRPKYVLELMPCLSFFFYLFVCIINHRLTKSRN